VAKPYLPITRQRVSDYMSQAPIVKLDGIVHKNKEWIRIACAHNHSINAVLRNLPNSTFSATHKSWLTPLKRENYFALRQQLYTAAQLDVDGLRTYLQQRSTPSAKLVAIPTVSGNALPEEKVTRPRSAERIPPSPSFTEITFTGIHAVNSHVLPNLRQHLILKDYSKNTIRTYLGEMLQFLQTIKGVPADSMGTDRIKKYLAYCFEVAGLKEATVHSRINALKCYYEQVLKREKFFYDIPRPKKHLQLPKVLSEKEIGRLFRSIPNIKHKAILFTAYSAGLRVSEVVHLKISDIDSVRMQIFVENSKGKKDRYVGLGVLLLDVLRAYLQHCSPRPKIYLFENPFQPGEAYSVRAAQKVFQHAKEQSGIIKQVGIHSLRHSFATHLLEKGIDIRYIKDILGHFSIKTTERYLHVKKELLINIPNPLDELLRQGEVEW
jgi:integrase/recombinase XerD